MLPLSATHQPPSSRKTDGHASNGVLGLACVPLLILIFYGGSLTLFFCPIDDEPFLTFAQGASWSDLLAGDTPGLGIVPFYCSFWFALYKLLLLTCGPEPVCDQDPYFAPQSVPSIREERETVLTVRSADGTVGETPRAGPSTGHATGQAGCSRASRTEPLASGGPAGPRGA